ncbi:TadE family type IV pilus minor pilin [Mobilicoccus massiliensis]|uniref:TadE family type IV pilus minor pilin n=1 Tax=Mobilicoccus massiliensis TaxID=1522310 RepID=UPI00164DD353
MTAEMAAAMPVVVLLLALVLTSVRVGVDQMRCVDAARAGARAAARGEGDDAVGTVVARAAPRGSRVSISRVDTDVVVDVSAPAVLRVPLLDALPSPAARATSVLEGTTERGASEVRPSRLTGGEGERADVASSRP